MVAKTDSHLSETSVKHNHRQEDETMPGSASKAPDKASRGSRSRALHRLTARQVETAIAGQAIHDGGGLYLRVSTAGSRKWEFRYNSPVTGKRVDMGLGSANKGFVGLAAARQLAAEARELIAKGVDPIIEREKAAAAARALAARPKPKAFGDFAEEWMLQNLGQYRNEKHRDQWRSTLRQHAKPLWTQVLDEIGTDDILDVLRPIWTKTPETAKRTQGRIEKILDAARAAGLRSGENPARWRGHLSLLLPKRQKPSHHPAMSYRDIQAFMYELRKLSSVSARALEFLILTAARSGEVRGMTWAELDEARTTWTVPATRMKAGLEHRVPLSARAIEILAFMEALRPKQKSLSDLVFPGASKRTKLGMLSDMTLSAVLRHMRERKGADAELLRAALTDSAGNPVVVHGFRSTFRDWAEDEAGYSARVVEHALAHTIKDKAEAAYRRGDAFEQRKNLMQAWASFLGGLR